MGDSRITLEFLQTLLQEEYPALTIKSIYEAPGSKRGDNYTAMLYRVNIEGTLAPNDEEFRSSLIYKCLPESPTRREAFKSDALFCNEVAFYTKIVPKFIEFKKEHSNEKSDRLRAIPKCYLAQNDLLILEDLQCRDFIMVDRRNGLTPEQCCSVLKELAHFHAVSLAMKYQECDPFYELINMQDGISESLFDSSNEEWYRDYYRAAAHNAVAMLRDATSDIENSEKYLEKFTDFAGDGTFFMKMVDLVAPEEPLAVICHGDCWINNILFQLDDNSDIKEVCLVDFQLVRYGSPALDLANLIYCCTTRDQRTKCLESFLKYYTNTLHAEFMNLNDTENYNGVLTDKTALYDLIKDEFYRCGKFALGLALDMFPIMTCDSDQAPDLYQLKDDDDESQKNIPVWTSNDACKKKLLDLVQELVDNDQL